MLPRGKANVVQAKASATAAAGSVSPGRQTERETFPDYFSGTGKRCGPQWFANFTDAFLPKDFVSDPSLPDTDGLVQKFHLTSSATYSQ